MTTVQSYSVTDVVQITEAAAKHFANVLKRTEKNAIRLTLKEAGCTGFKYVLDEVDAAQAGDITKNLENGVCVYIDAEHLNALQGTRIDYVTEGVNQNLKIDNPNVKDACGCGESFSV